MKKESSKSPLALMELMVMILVFAVAAVLCVQAFVRADLFSKQLYHRDRAVNLCQTVAETVKAEQGDFLRAADVLGAETTAEELLLYYSKDWTPVAADAAVYTVSLKRGVTDGYVTAADVCVTDEENEVLFSLPVSWQEVAYE